MIKNNITAHDFGDYNSSKSVNKIKITSVKDLKDYIKNMLVPILNCVYLENKYLVFKDNSVFKITISN